MKRFVQFFRKDRKRVEYQIEGAGANWSNESEEERSGIRVAEKSGLGGAGCKERSINGVKLRGEGLLEDGAIAEDTLDKDNVQEDKDKDEHNNDPDDSISELETDDATVKDKNNNNDETLSTQSVRRPRYRDVFRKSVLRRRRGVGVSSGRAVASCGSDSSANLNQNSNLPGDQAKRDPSKPDFAGKGSKPASSGKSLNKQSSHTRGTSRNKISSRVTNNSGFDTSVSDDDEHGHEPEDDDDDDENASSNRATGKKSFLVVSFFNTNKKIKKEEKRNQSLRGGGAMGGRSDRGGGGGGGEEGVRGTISSTPMNWSWAQPHSAQGGYQPYGPQGGYGFQTTAPPGAYGAGYGYNDPNQPLPGPPPPPPPGPPPPPPERLPPQPDAQITSEGQKPVKLTRNADVYDGIKEAEMGPPPPPAKIAGYEDDDYDQERDVAPPAEEELEQDETLAKSLAEAKATNVDVLEEFKIDAEMTDKQVIDVLIKEVHRHCCWCEAEARELKIIDKIPSPGLRYTMRSYCESRKTAWKTIPYRGGPISGPQNGSPPPVWSVCIPLPNMWQCKTIKKEIPYTAYLKCCHCCHGKGCVRHNYCNGTGQDTCGSCYGRGTREVFQPGSGSELGQNKTVDCNSCNGTGKKRCFGCEGSGNVVCTTCNGYKSLKNFIELTVNFHTVTSPWVFERTNLPDELLLGCVGKTVFGQVLPRVMPIQGHKVAALNYASYDFYMQHRKIECKERIHYQSQHVEAIPVLEVEVEHKKDKTVKCYVWWIYGLDRRVWFPDYPGRCLCGGAFCCCS